MRKLLVAAATLAALAGNAYAEIGYIGNTINIKGAKPAYGCVDVEDALALDRVPQYAEWQLVREAEWNALRKVDNRWRGCLRLNRTPDEAWKIVDKQFFKHRSGDALFCLQSTLDFSDQREVQAEKDRKSEALYRRWKGEPEPSMPSTPPKSYDETYPRCFWVVMLNK
jgi:hypothetical protein